MPHISWSKDYITTVVAVFGTTISPYLFFWQASQEVEELHSKDAQQALKHAPLQGAANLKRIRLDTLIGMAFSNVIAFFIVLTAAATLHAHGITNIQTSSQAAQALKPIAGALAFMLFSIGIVGTGLLALPVLAGSAAYAMAGTFKWRNSLESKPRLAKHFYGIIVLACLGGVAVTFTPIDPIKALYWSAVINGVVSVPIMVLLMFMVVNRKIMGEFIAPALLRILGWIATAVMGLAAVGMFWFMLT